MIDNNYLGTGKLGEEMISSENPKLNVKIKCLLDLVDSEDLGI